MSQIAKIEFTIELEWTQDGLVIWCPTKAARDFIARVIDDKPIVIKVKEEK